VKLHLLNCIVSAKIIGHSGNLHRIKLMAQSNITIVIKKTSTCFEWWVFGRNQKTRHNIYYCHSHYTIVVV